MSKKLDLIKDTNGLINIYSNNINIGAFDEIDFGERYAFFPKRNDKIDGDDLIAVGHELNKLNNQGS